MTETEQKLRTENEQLKRELAELKRKSAPQVEILDEKHVKFDGQVFYKHKDGHFIRTVSLHEAVWRFHFGDIPEGYVIHHRNRDKADNRIENLQLMTNEEHRAWHNQHDKISYRCDYCGKEIEKSVTGRSGKLHFCSGQCWGRYIAENKLYHEEHNCVICGKKFSSLKYSKTKTCSPECRSKLISLTKRNKKPT